MVNERRAPIINLGRQYPGLEIVVQPIAGNPVLIAGVLAVGPTVFAPLGYRRVTGARVRAGILGRGAGSPSSGLAPIRFGHWILGTENILGLGYSGTVHHQ